MAITNGSFANVLGYLLVHEPNLVLVTGGLLRGTKPSNLASVDWCFVEGAVERLREEGRSEISSIETVLPEKDRAGLERFRVGNTVTLRKKSPQARRFALVNSVDAIVTVEGGKATKQQIDLALAIEKPVLPLPFTGGSSRDAWDDNREMIQALFSIDADTAQLWESTSLEALDSDGVQLLAVSVKGHLMSQLKRRCFVIMPFSDDYMP